MQIKYLTAVAIEKNIQVYLLQPGQFQPRKEFNEVSLQELSASIKEMGVLSRIIVRAINPEKFEIIAGERRWRAAQLAGLHEVLCKIIKCNNEQALQIALVENLARQDLNPIEEAKGIQRLIVEFNYTQDEAAEILSKPRSTLTNLLRLLDLHPEVQRLIVQSELTGSHGKILAALPLAKQFYLARESIIKRWSIRELEKAVVLYSKTTDVATLRAMPADIERLARHLSDYLSAPVVLNANKNHKGAIGITFNNLDELDGILEKIGYKHED
jgi:ParB family chromosome partitioning protein